MVYHVLELYLYQKKHYKKQSRQIADVKYNLTVIYICLIITSILWIIELFIQILTVFIADLVVIVALVALLFIVERKNIKKSKDRVKVYDDFLNELQGKMIINGINWAEGQRLDYLIYECDRIINTRDKEAKKLIRYTKVLALPIVSFIADIINEKYDLVFMPELFALILVIIIISLFLFVLINLISKFTDLLLKTGSISEMRNLRNTLLDVKNKSL